ncbi:DUF120 domain-containing protein [Lentisphaerota bacterium ZTH]|nr:DUF120 domain-containing protein [Lentisphaerota bacterium]WET06354.1 DUF120 domain-containing protein [Lentisphaerota bacterium ZTH]
MQGKVKSGIGDLARWMIKLRDLYASKLGREMYPGSLNIELDDPLDFPQDDIRIEPGEGANTVGVSITGCVINGHRAFALRTDNNECGTGDHPKTILEVISEVRLRDYLDLKDGDTVEIDLNYTSEAGLIICSENNQPAGR